MYYGIWWAGSVMAKSFLTHSYVRFKDLRFSLFTLICGHTHSCNQQLCSPAHLIISTGISPLLNSGILYLRYCRWSRPAMAEIQLEMV